MSTRVRTIGVVEGAARTGKKLLELLNYQSKPRPAGLSIDKWLAQLFKAYPVQGTQLWVFREPRRVRKQRSKYALLKDFYGYIAPPRARQIRMGRADVQPRAARREVVDRLIAQGAGWAEINRELLRMEGDQNVRAVAAAEPQRGPEPPFVRPEPHFDDPENFWRDDENR